MFGRIGNRMFAGLSRPLCTSLVHTSVSKTLISPRITRAYSTPLVQNVKELVSFKPEYFKPEPKSLLPLKEATDLYARIHMHTWDMLVTKGDIVQVPARLKNLKVGDTLSFTECSEIGSRQYTLSGGDEKVGRICPSVFTIRGVVTGLSRVKRHIKLTTRRRRRHVKHAVSMQSLTVMRISEIALK